MCTCAKETGKCLLVVLNNILGHALKAELAFVSHPAVIVIGGQEPTPLPNNPEAKLPPTWSIK